MPEAGSLNQGSKGASQPASGWLAATAGWGERGAYALAPTGRLHVATPGLPAWRGRGASLPCTCAYYVRASICLTGWLASTTWLYMYMHDADAAAQPASRPTCRLPGCTTT